MDNLFVSIDADRLERRIAQAARADRADEVGRLGHAIDSGAAMFCSWAQRVGGSAIGSVGDAVRVTVPADRIGELPALIEQYEHAVGTSLSVGVGTKLSEAETALAAAKLRGGDQAVLYSDAVGQEVMGLAPDQDQKTRDEFGLGKGESFTKAAPLRPQAGLPSEPGYAYHATNEGRAYDIAQGHLETHRPHEFTEQDIWPDGSTQKRSYHSPDAGVVHSFAPEEGPHVILRTRRDVHPFREEAHTGDLYSTKPIPAHHIEIGMDDGTWHPLQRWAGITKSEPPDDGPAQGMAAVSADVSADPPPTGNATNGAPSLPIPAGSLADDLRQLAQEQLDATAGRSRAAVAVADGTRARLVSILRSLNDPAKLRELAQSAPGVTDVLSDLVATIRDLARSLPRGAGRPAHEDNDPPDAEGTPVEKAGTGNEKGREHVVLPVGATKDGKVKVGDGPPGMGGRSHWVSVRAGMVLGPENDHAVSSRNPGGG